MMITKFTKDIILKESIRVYSTKIYNHPMLERPRYIKREKYQKPKDDLQKLWKLEDGDIVKPFLNMTIERGHNSAEEPILIPSMNSTRLIACFCDSEGFIANYLLLKKEETQQCSCGTWYKLVKAISPFRSDKGKPF